jgi:glucuronokinase
LFYFASITVFLKLGGDSGKVHSTVKERWVMKDPILVAGMQAIGSYADEAKDCLREKNYKRLGELMEMNFKMRRELYSDAVVGEKNIQVAELAKLLGLSVKFTGSGGAFVGIRSDGSGWFSAEEEKEIHGRFQEHQFEFVRIEIPEH